MKINENEDHTMDYSSRATNIGYQTQQHNEIQQKIEQLVLIHNLQLCKFIELCSEHPRIKEQYNLISELFARKDLIEDIIRFLFVPTQMMSKHCLSVIKSFLTDNNQFYEHFFLALHTRKLNIEIWFQFLYNHKIEAHYPSSLANLNDVFIPIVKYEYSSSSRICQYFQNEQKDHSILILNYFSVELIERLVGFTKHHAVFQVLFNLIIASLEEQEWRVSLIILQKLFKSSITDTLPHKTIQTHIESIYTMITQVSNNISKDKHNTIFAFTNAIHQSKFISCCINTLHFIIEQHLLADLIQELNEHDKQTIEFNLKCLSQIINIYYLLRKNGIDNETEQMKKMKVSIMHLFHQFPTLLPLLKSSQQKSFTLSNGENIKAISLYKYQFFNLIKNSLQVIKDYGQNNQDLVLNLQKVHILDLSIKYLTEYRWNNTLHCVLQKIISLTISKQIFKSKSNIIHKMLDHLIYSFINKKFLFLNSMRMTNQGNLHFIYNVSCLISLELQKAHTFYDIINPYEQWNTFMKTLEKYEQRHKKYKQSQLITDEQIHQSQRNDKYGLKVEIDELVSIKQIIEKRQIYTKWRHKVKTQAKKQNQFHRINNSAKNSKSSSKLISNQSILLDKGIRKSSEYHQKEALRHSLEKKLSSSDGFAKQILKKSQSIDSLNEFNEVKSQTQQVQHQI